jgi:DnaJ homologue, subfamily C, member 28, conserved domain
MRDWESAIDRQIRKAIEDGEFANLPGEGKPLKLEDDPNTPDQLQMAFKILRENDMAPEWIMYGKDLESKQVDWLEKVKRAYQAYRTALADPQRYPQAEANWQRVQQKLGEDAARLNKEINIYNLKVPKGITHRPLVDLQREIRQLSG